MSRYIDADELLRMMRNSREDNPCDFTQRGIYTIAHDCCISCVDAMPTADVVEVKRGYWYIREYEFFTCSECGHDYWNGCDYTVQAKERLANGEHPNYCPNCGAKMDGERR